MVWVGDGGILKNVARPMDSVMIPSMRKSHLQSKMGGQVCEGKYTAGETHLHPALPWTPLIRSTPKAIKLAMILQTLEDIQNKARRKGSSRFV